MTLHEATERSKSGWRRAQLVERTRRMRELFLGRGWRGRVDGSLFFVRRAGGHDGSPA